MDFKVFKKAVSKQQGKMLSQPLFRTGISPDLLWETYLASFPEGTNPIFRERTEHDCSCCRQFVRAVGDMVVIGDNGKLETIWDINISTADMVQSGGYQVVADAMAKLVRSQPIDNIFLHEQRLVGVDKNYELTAPDCDPITWEHFSVSLPVIAVCKKDNIGSRLGQARSTFEVFERGMQELSIDSMNIVLDLIGQNSLYRGEQHKQALKAYRDFKKNYDLLAEGKRNTYCWMHAGRTSDAIARLRNTSIGTLLINLSEGMDLEAAVGKYEAMVAPANYQRPTALITKGMIEKAEQKMEALGLVPALDRRHANINDITINNVLFADREAKKAMGAFDALKEETAVNMKSLEKVESVEIDRFIKDIMPTATSIDMFLENKQTGNLFSLIAPVDPEAKGMFQWHNNFGWTYNGEMADSMKENVKKAGGKVDGDIRFSIQWNDENIHNNSDYDAHCVEHPHRNRIYYSEKYSHFTKGQLDVDITGPKAGVPAVENITYPDRKNMKDGEYTFLVHNFSSRAGDTGFRAEIEFDGTVHSYDCSRKLKQGEKVNVATITLDRGRLTIKHHLDSQAASKQVWNLATQQFHKVRTIMYSPNYWDEKVQGNRHYFFVLDNCIQEGEIRGFYNEFLSPELKEHRKVFEVLGSKLRVPFTDQQLSGLGFSSTQRNNAYVKVVSGSLSRTLKLIF